MNSQYQWQVRYRGGKIENRTMTDTFYAVSKGSKKLSCERVLKTSFTLEIIFVDHF